MPSIRSLVPTALKQQLQKMHNWFQKDETIEESKGKWDSLAQENSRYYIMSNHGKSISEEEFRESGENDVRDLLLHDKLLQEKIAPFPQKTLLEIGCGTGRLTEFLADHFQKVIGLDISEKMIEEGKQRLVKRENIDLFATDGVTYPLQNNSVDCVFSYIVFQHMPDQETVRKNVEEISRVLKSGGIAKIQLRGVPITKGQWFYGPSFTAKEVPELLSGLSLDTVRIEGENTRYFWVWLQKQ